MQSKRNRDDDSVENSSDSSHEAKPRKKSKKELKEDVRQVHTATTGRTGGVYIPPFKMRLIEKSIKDKESKEYQRLTWDALKKSLNGIVNKVSQKNIAKIIPELFGENLMRGKGPLCQSLIKAQAAAVGFSNVYASLVAVINTKLPEIGELLSKRLISSWTKAYQRNQKSTLIATSIFIAHMVNQYVIGSLVPLQILALLLDKPTDDGVEVAVNFIKECGQRLSKMSPKPFNGIFNVFRSILHEGTLDKRVQYMIEHLFIVRKSNFAEHPAMIEELDLVEPGDQVTHDYLSLDDDYDEEDLGENLNIFNYDEDFEESERKYEAIRKEILGDSDEESSEDEEEQGEGDAAGQIAASGSGMVVDKTSFDTVTFKKQVFLTVMSSLDFEECAHKLLKAGVPPNYELDLCRMLVDCCSQERSYRRFYGLLCQRLCVLKQNFRSHFQDTCFAEQYENCHMLETNRLRHVALLYSHLLYSDAIAWSVFSCIHLNVEETNPSKRIFIKTIFKELSEFLGDKLNERLQDPDMQEYYAGIMPKNDPEQTRFSINFFTSIGLGPITVDMRNHLKALKDKKSISLLPSSSEESSSSVTTSSDDSDNDTSSSSDSSSEEDRRRKGRKQIEDKKETSKRDDRGRNEMRVEIKKEDNRDTRKEMPRESQQRDNRENPGRRDERREPPRDDDRTRASAQDTRRENPRDERRDAPRDDRRDNERREERRETPRESRGDTRETSRGDDLRRRDSARDKEEWKEVNPRDERRDAPRDDRREASRDDRREAPRDDRRDNERSYRDNNRDRDDRRRENERRDDRRDGARDTVRIKREPEF
jgi:pre-mRNA-splicing factor CWC22